MLNPLLGLRSARCQEREPLDARRKQCAIAWIVTHSCVKQKDMAGHLMSFVRYSVLQKFVNVLATKRI